MHEFDVVIIGGGPAGRVIVHALHHARSSKSVAVIKDEEENVNRCAVPYGISKEKTIEKYIIPNSLITDFGAQLFVDTVTVLDTKDQVLTTKGGERLKYGQLVFATGAKPFVPDLPGVESDNIVVVRDLADLERLRAFGSKAKRAVVIGAGFIGIEAAVVYKRMGLSVSLVSDFPYVMQASFEADLAPLIHADLIDHGVDIRTEVMATAFRTEGQRASSVVLSNNDKLEGDFFVLAIGVKPNIELAAAAGINVNPGGIETNSSMETNVSNIFAAGDCVAKRSFVSGQPTKGEFGTNAVFMAKVVADNILAKKRNFPGVINANCAKAFELGFGSAGLGEKQAREHGFDPVCGYSEVLDKYPMMNNNSKVKTKLVFDRNSTRLLGGSIVRKGYSVAHNVDLLSLAIQKQSVLEDFLLHQYATHPELAAKPSDNMWLFAAKDALVKINNSGEQKV